MRCEHLWNWKNSRICMLIEGRTHLCIAAEFFLVAAIHDAFHFGINFS